MKKIEETVCPVCGNRCPAERLRCPRGMKYFGVKPVEKDISAMSADEAVIHLMRKCGHHLHHNVGHNGADDSGALLSVLSNDEKRTLIELLKKCVDSWN